MKALIRGLNETVLESHNLVFINWDTGAPLTNPEWSGGPYILVNDYVPETPDVDFAETPEPIPAEDEETVTINGKEYTVEEARKILGVKL